MEASNLPLGFLRGRLRGPLGKTLCFAAAAVLLFGWVGLAGAQGRSMTGKEFLDSKDSKSMTLHLDELVVHVTDDTLIYNGDDNKRIKFESIPDPSKGSVIVEYSGSASGKNEMIARRLVVKLAPR